MSDYYTASNAPATSSNLSSATVRAEFSAIEAGTDKLIDLSSNANKVVKVNSGGTAQEASSITDDGTNVSLSCDLDFATPKNISVGGTDIIALTTTGASAATGKTLEATSGPSGSAFGFRNSIQNGAFSIDQRNSGAAQTITAAAALAYTVDRWYGYCTGANVTGQRVAGTAPNQYNYRYTGAASVTKIGHAQRIEAANCQHLAGTTATLAVDLANSLLTTVTWTAWYANTADTFGTLASPTRTSISSGTFTVTSTLTRYSTNITIPAGATTGIEVEFSVAAQTSGTWTIGRVQLESGGLTPFEARDYGDVLRQCQRYYQRKTYATSQLVTTIQAYSTTTGDGVIFLPTSMRSGGTSSVSATNGFKVTAATGATTDCTAGTLAQNVTDNQCPFRAVASSAVLVAGNCSIVVGSATPGYIEFNAEL